jgi:hypothetical protein
MRENFARNVFAVEIFPIFQAETDAVAIGTGVANNFFRNGVDSARGCSKIGGLSPEPNNNNKTLVNV